MVKLKPETKRANKPLLSARGTSALSVIFVLVLVLGVFGASAAWEKPAPSQQPNDTAQNLTKLVGKLPLPQNVAKNVTTSARKGKLPLPQNVAKNVTTSARKGNGTPSNVLMV